MHHFLLTHQGGQISNDMDACHRGHIGQGVDTITGCTNIRIEGIILLNCTTTYSSFAGLVHDTPHGKLYWCSSSDPVLRGGCFVGDQEHVRTQYRVGEIMA